jgi:osmotically inducible protein OsmC
MADRTAHAEWEGNLLEGRGQLTMDNSRLLDSVPITWAARTEDPGGMTSPEELLAAAQASCYAMAFSNYLAKAELPPDRLDVEATATFVPGQGVTTMKISVRGRVPGVDSADQFRELAEGGEKACPIANAIRGNVDIQLTAELEPA